MQEKRHGNAVNPKSWTQLRRFTFYMKLTYVDKVKIYKERREEGISLRELSLKWKVYISTVEYLIRLVD